MTFRTLTPFAARLVLFGALVSAQLVDAPQLYAQRDSDQIRDALAHFEAGNFAEAQALFLAAHAVDPSARALRGAALCAVELGDDVAALRLLDRALREDHHPLRDSQREQAQERVIELHGRVGRYRVVLTPANATLWVDGARVELPAALIEELLVLPRGAHRVRVEAPGFAPFEQELVVEPGQDLTLRVRLTVDDGAAAPDETDDAATNDDTADDFAPEAGAGGVRMWAPGWGFVGLGAATALASAVPGAMALAQQSTLDDECPGRVCATDRSDDARHGQELAAMADGVLTAGLLITALGVALVFTVPTDTEEDADAQALLDCGPVRGGARCVAGLQGSF